MSGYGKKASFSVKALVKSYRILIFSGKDISDIQFPAITICGQGWIGDVLTKSLLKQYREFVINDGQQASGRKKRSISTLKFGENPALEKKWMQAYYPGAFLDPKVSMYPSYILNY